MLLFIYLLPYFLTTCVLLVYSLSKLWVNFINMSNEIKVFFPSPCLVTILTNYDSCSFIPWKVLLHCFHPSSMFTVSDVSLIHIDLLVNLLTF